MGNTGPVKTFHQHKLWQLCIYKNNAKKPYEMHLLFRWEQLIKVYDKYGITRFAQNINSYTLIPEVFVWKIHNKTNEYHRFH